MTEIMNAIGLIGFPAVFSLLLFWYITKKDEKHEKEIEKMTTALNNNTMTIQRLADKMGVTSNGQN